MFCYRSAYRFRLTIPRLSNRSCSILHISVAWNQLPERDNICGRIRQLNGRDQVQGSRNPREKLRSPIILPPFLRPLSAPALQLGAVLRTFSSLRTISPAAICLKSAGLQKPHLQLIWITNSGSAPSVQRLRRSVGRQPWPRLWLLIRR